MYSYHIFYSVLFIFFFISNLYAKYYKNKNMYLTYEPEKKNKFIIISLQEYY